MRVETLKNKNSDYVCRFPKGFGKLLEFGWRIHKLGGVANGCFILNGDAVFVLSNLCGSDASGFLGDCHNVLYNRGYNYGKSSRLSRLQMVFKFLKCMNDLIGRYKHFVSAKVSVSSTSRVEISLTMDVKKDCFEEVRYEISDTLPYHVDCCRNKVFVGGINGFDVFYHWGNNFLVVPKSGTHRCKVAV